MDFSFDDVIDDFNIARRMVQLTGLSWEWDCLAKFEQQLPESKLLSKFSDILGTATADLSFTSLEYILGFEIKLAESINGPRAY